MQSKEKDTTFTKVFVGGLPYHTTHKSLREHFEVFGDIEEAAVIHDKYTGKSKGYGFVTMATREAAERVCKESNPIIDGRRANVNLAILGARNKGNLAAAATLPFASLPALLRPGFPAILPTQYWQAVHTAGAASPYWQQLYAAPYMHPNIFSQAGMSGADPYSGHPQLEFYNQYAAAAYPTAVTQAVVPAVQSSCVDSGNAAAMAAGGYIGYYNPISAQHLTAAGLTAAAAAGLPYAAGAAPVAAAGVATQPQAAAAETRIH